MKQAKSAGMTLDDFENPVVDKMKPFTQSILTDGAGTFGGAITEELGKRKMNINVIGWDLWENPAQEADRIARLLDLKVQRVYFIRRKR